MTMVRLCYRVAIDAFYRFNADDGWAIASHIALSMLMSMFPFLILVTAIAGFVGSTDLADEVARLIVAAWPREVSGGIAGEIHSVLTTARGDVLTVGAVFAIYFFLERRREPAHRAQSRLRARSSRGRGGCCGWNRSATCWSAPSACWRCRSWSCSGRWCSGRARSTLPWLDPLESHYDIGRFAVATVLLTPRC